MFPGSIADRDVQLKRLRDSLAIVRSWLATEVRPNWIRSSEVGSLRQVGGAIRAAFTHVGALACDSREGLSSKERQLAAYGISWTTDPAYEAELARELQVARLRHAPAHRRAGRQLIDDRG